MLCLKPKYLIILLLICFSLLVYPNISLAETKYNQKQQLFLNFENKIEKMVAVNMKQLEKLDIKIKKEMDKESLYHIVLSTKEIFAEDSKAVAKLEIPSILPENIKKSLIVIKSDFSFGFKALEESMTYYTKYLDTEDPVFFWKSVKKRDIGITHINGGFTSLTTMRMQLITPPRGVIPNNEWEVVKKYLHLLYTLNSLTDK
jgi:hypothetical protein